MNIAEIEELKLQVERKYGKVLGTSTDFYDFSLVMERLTGNHISPSTLKRMWGYVNDTHKPRRLTLDLLSRYLDYEDYQAFLRWLKTTTQYNSSFFSARQLISSEQATGTTIEIGWSPNRLVRLRYLGDSQYEVVKSENSKMKAGDKFMTGCFIMEQPLYLPYIEREGERTPPFIAGRNGGLTVIRIFENGLP